MEKIIECILQVEGRNRHFIFEGDVNKEEDLETGTPFYNLQVLEMDEHGIHPFEIRATTWIGNKLTVQDALNITIAQYSRGYTALQIIYMYEPLKEYVDRVTSETILLKGKIFPKKILFGTFLEPYKLFYVTDIFTYYCDDSGSFLMVRTEDRKEVASNEFAEMGFLSSVDAVASGEETLYFKSDDFNESL